jgi:hypothetical protein
MKKTITLLFLCCLCAFHVIAQDTATYVNLSFTQPIALIAIQQNGNGTVNPVFNNAGVNNIMSRYSFTTFKQAYPESRFPYVQQIYKVAANSAAFTTDLNENFPGYFHFSIQRPVQLLSGRFTPTDWEGLDGTWQVYTWYLDYIYAREAWNDSIPGCQGYPSVRIGVTDNGFFLDTLSYEGNPDLISKIASVGINDFPASKEPEHGTMVAGLVAGATNNGIGYPAIGFNCMLDLDQGTDAAMLALSNSGRKILNASWTYDYTGSPNLELASIVNGIDNFAGQDLYNEIYENGTITCFAAGNSSDNTTAPWWYLYPASFDHIISVTNVLGETCLWVDAMGTGSDCDHHNFTVGDSTSTYHHNPRVDICAPAKRVGGLTYVDTEAVGNDARYYSHDAGWGTSFASPLVAGTLGLMESVDSLLSPYQLEYLLKESSRDIYNVPDNFYLKGTTRWNSRAGAGALDADSAVRMAAHLDPNDPATQTFYIEGIELNTICAPGKSANGVNPKFIPILTNGTPPYTYRWDPIFGNTTTLDDSTSGTPTVVSSHPGPEQPNLAYYRLTVYDASEIQKVANRNIRVTLRTDQTYDLAMRDSYMDMLSEPDSEGYVDPRDGNSIWASPDIWNRQINDGGRTPQDVQYFSAGTPNYMYVRVRNVGCADYTTTNNAQLHAYWTLSSTGENWPADWTTAMVAGAVSGSSEPGGQEITNLGSVTPVAIPLMHPGDTFVTAIPWHPANPGLYVGTPSSMDVCGLARIVEPNKPDFGLYAPESSYIRPNVANNNNIVTRNMTEVNLGHKFTPFDLHQIVFANAGTITQTFSLQMLVDRDIQRHFAGNLSEDMYVNVKLDDSLRALWLAGGSQGNYVGTDNRDGSLVYNPGTPFQLNNITLPPGAKYTVTLSFTLKPGVIRESVINQKIHFRQLLDTGGVSPMVYGTVSFAMNIVKDTIVAVPPGVLAVTEMSNGPSGDCEYGEMIVANCGTDTSAFVDVRGWIVDDNSGNFDTAGCMDNVGVAQGHYRLAYDSVWNNVPVGSIIAMYNHDANCYNLPDTFTVDTTATGLVYWIPIGGTVAAPYGTPHVERFGPSPAYSDCAYCADSTTTYTIASAWESTIGLNNTADALQVRCPGCTVANTGTPAFYHGIGYGSLTGADAYASILAGANSLGGPVISGTGTGKKYVFTGSSASDLGSVSAWTKATADAAGLVPATLGNVPGAFMSAVTSHSLNLPCCGTMNTAAMRKAQPVTVIADQGISVYPNPATSTVNFTFPLAAKTEIKLMDISGRVMATQTMLNTTAASFNVSSYAPGMYLYQVTTDGHKQYGKILVSK